MTEKKQITMDEFMAGAPKALALQAKAAAAATPDETPKTKTVVFDDSKTKTVIVVDDDPMIIRDDDELKQAPKRKKKLRRHDSDSDEDDLAKRPLGPEWQDLVDLFNGQLAKTLKDALDGTRMMLEEVSFKPNAAALAVLDKYAEAQETIDASLAKMESIAAEVRARRVRLSPDQLNQRRDARVEQLTELFAAANKGIRDFWLDTDEVQNEIKNGEPEHPAEPVLKVFDELCKALPDMVVKYHHSQVNANWEYRFNLSDIVLDIGKQRLRSDAVVSINYSRSTGTVGLDITFSKTSRPTWYKAAETTEKARQRDKTALSKEELLEATHTHLLPMFQQHLQEILSASAPTIDADDQTAGKGLPFVRAKFEAMLKDDIGKLLAKSKYNSILTPAIFVVVMASTYGCVGGLSSENLVTFDSVFNNLVVEQFAGAYIVDGINTGEWDDDEKQHVETARRQENTASAKREKAKKKSSSRFIDNAAEDDDKVSDDEAEEDEATEQDKAFVEDD